MLHVLPVTPSELHRLLEWGYQKELHGALSEADRQLVRQLRAALDDMPDVFVPAAIPMVATA